MNAQPKRPKRQRKGDRLLSPGASEAEVRCDHAIAPMDRLAIEMERKWGIDRLPALVDPETAGKFGAAMAYLNTALAENDPTKTAAAAQNIIRGLHAMDKAATAAGHAPASGEVWEAEIDGFRFGIMRDADEWRTARDQNPTLTLFSMREVALALQALNNDDLLATAKDAFPGSTITAVQSRMGKIIDDEIPF